MSTHTFNSETVLLTNNQQIGSSNFTLRDASCNAGDVMVVSNRNNVFGLYNIPSTHFEWATQSTQPTVDGQTNSGYGSSIICDTSGNIYVTGRFVTDVQFGATTLTNSGNISIYVAKMNSSGSWVWAYQSTGSGNAYGNGITIDTSGNLYITGYFTGSTTFGSTTLTNSSGYDAFIAKMNSSGTWVWATQSTHTSGNAEAYAIAIDSSSNLYITGKFDTDSTFGSTTLTNSGTDAIYVAKMNSSGSWIWATQTTYTSSTGAEAYSITVDSSNDILIIGSFRIDVIFGATTLTSSDYAVCVAKINSSGAWVWASQSTHTGIGLAYGNSIVADSSNNLYITGTFEKNATMSSSLISFSLLPFVAKLNSSGSWLWASQANYNNTYNHKADSIKIDSNNNLYIVGTFISELTFGSTTLLSDITQSYFPYVAIIDSSGNWISAYQTTSTNSQGNVNSNAVSIIIDNTDNKYMYYGFDYNLTLGTTKLSTIDQTIFVSKINNQENISTIPEKIVVARESGSLSNSISCGINGIISSFSGLTTGSFYYLQTNSTISTTKSDQLIGVAINSTTILFEPSPTYNTFSQIL